MTELLYQIRLETASNGGASGHAGVGIELVGDNGSTKFHLTRHNWIEQRTGRKVFLPDGSPDRVITDLFQRAKEDIFEQEIKEDIGKIIKLIVHFSDTASKTNRKLKRIVIVNHSINPAVVTPFGFKLSYLCLDTKTSAVAQLIPGEEN